MGDSRPPPHPPPPKKSPFEILLILYTHISIIRTLTHLTFLRRHFCNSDVSAISDSILKFKGRD